MGSRVEVQKPARTRVGERNLQTEDLPAGSGLNDGDARGACHLGLVLQGSFTLQGMEIGPGGWVFNPGRQGAAGSGGCRLAVVSWAGAETPLAAKGSPCPSGVWYDKYEAALAPIELEEPAGKSLLAPWSGYWIEIPPGDGTAAVHVHHDLINILAIAGERGKIAGRLLVGGDAGIRAWPLRAGDLAVVETDVVHNLVPEPEGPPLRFFVFNDSPSHYQQAASSDYHNLRRVEVASLPLAARDGDSPLYFHVRRD